MGSPGQWEEPRYLHPAPHFSVCLLEGGLCDSTMWSLVVLNRPGYASSVCWMALDPAVPVRLSSLPQSSYSNATCLLISGVCPSPVKSTAYVLIPLD